MKNIKDRISERSRKIDEASGFGNKEPMKKSKPSYEDDFDDMVSISEMETKIEQLKKDYKKAKSKDEKMKILEEQNNLRAKIQIAKEDD